MKKAKKVKKDPLYREAAKLYKEFEAVIFLMKPLPYISASAIAGVMIAANSCAKADSEFARRHMLKLAHKSLDDTFKHMVALNAS